MIGSKLVLQDVWDAGVGLQRIQDEGVNFTMASTPFLADLAGHPGVDTYDISSLEIFVAGGAPIPRALVHTATERLKTSIASGWGMTENLLLTTTRLDDPPEKIFNTDGVPVPGMQLRVVDATGKVLGPDQEGDLQSRGPSHFVGYLKRPEMYGMDAEGWFNTGDIATLDADGYVRITGRGKDILIRGGENVPVIEIEQLLYRHQAVQAVAVVGVPDPRLGERGVAYVIPKSGQAFTLDEMQRFLAEHRMAKNYWPEYLQVVNEFPRTPSGKIQKFKLREMAKTDIRIS
jgi:cyclohexanecarboxylate-CoA ligase